jgi:hypothetical protein
LFRRLFEVDYLERITIAELKSHPSLKEFFIKKPIGNDMLSVIE